MFKTGTAMLERRFARPILLAGAVALYPVVVAAAAVAEVPAQTITARFAPPNTPLVLSRTVYRTLVDGKQLVSTRRYAIRIAADGDGYLVSGELLSVDIQAPPLLAGLAEIERKRPDVGIFPVRLDAQGMIREGGSGQPDPAVRQLALARARGVIAATTIPAEGKRERSGLLGQVAGGPAGSAWPAFLFNPGPRERVETRRVPLADGGEGEVEVRITAIGLMPGGLAHQVERTITTRLAGTVRTSREIWTIESGQT